MPTLTTTRHADPTARQEAFARGAAESSKPFASELASYSRGEPPGTGELQRSRPPTDLQDEDEIHDCLFPTSYQRFGSLEIASAAAPEHTARGDYVERFVLPGDRLALVLADVSGRGMASMLRLIRLRNCIRGRIRQGLPLNELMNEINQWVLQDPTPEGSGAGQFITMFLAEYDAREETLTYASAGHFALLISAAGELATLKCRGLPLGIIDRPYQQSQPVQLEPDDLLYVGTDGIDEALGPRGERFGCRRLADVLLHHRGQTPVDILDDLFDALQRFRREDHPLDDAAAVIAKLSSVLDSICDDQQNGSEGSPYDTWVLDRPE